MHYTVETVEVDELDATERTKLYRTLVGIPCMKDGRGVMKSYVKDKLRTLKTDGMYGNEGGTMRAIRRVLLLYEGPKLRSARNTVVAFAVLCDTVVFHRLRPEHVAETVYLALLCGTGAWRLVNKLRSEYVDRGVGVTMDALPHTLAYYHQPAFGVVRMIDTAKSFTGSVRLQAAHKELLSAPEKKHKLETLTSAMLREIELGDAFSLAEESAFQGRSEPNYSYFVAHLVMWPSQASFNEMCIPDAPRRRARRA